MGVLGDLLGNIFSSFKPRLIFPSEKGEQVPVSVVYFNEKNLVKAVILAMKKSPLLLLSIKEFRESDKKGLAESLKELKSEAITRGGWAGLLDENWAIIVSKKASMVK